MQHCTEPKSAMYPQRFGTGSKCAVCEKEIFIGEVQLFQNQTYHNRCFTCAVCGKRIKLGFSSSKIDGEIGHKVCFKRRQKRECNLVKAPEKSRESAEGTRNKIPLIPKNPAQVTSHIPDPESREEGGNGKVNRQRRKVKLSLKDPAYNPFAAFGLQPKSLLSEPRKEAVEALELARAAQPGQTGMQEVETKKEATEEKEQEEEEAEEVVDMEKESHARTGEEERGADEAEGLHVVQGVEKEQDDQESEEEEEEEQHGAGGKEDDGEDEEEEQRGVEEKAEATSSLLGGQGLAAAAAAGEQADADSDAEWREYEEEAAALLSLKKQGALGDSKGSRGGAYFSRASLDRSVSIGRLGGRAGGGGGAPALGPSLNVWVTPPPDSARAHLRPPPLPAALPPPLPPASAAPPPRLPQSRPPPLSTEQLLRVRARTRSRLRSASLKSMRQYVRDLDTEAEEQSSVAAAAVGYCGPPPSSSLASPGASKRHNRTESVLPSNPIHLLRDEFCPLSKDTVLVPPPKKANARPSASFLHTSSPPTYRAGAPGGRVSTSSRPPPIRANKPAPGASTAVTAAAAAASKGGPAGTERLTERLTTNEAVLRAMHRAAHPEGAAPASFVTNKAVLQAILRSSAPAKSKRPRPPTTPYPGPQPMPPFAPPSSFSSAPAPAPAAAAYAAFQHGLRAERTHLQYNKQLEHKGSSHNGNLLFSTVAAAFPPTQAIRPPAPPPRLSASPSSNKPPPRQPPRQQQQQPPSRGQRHAQPHKKKSLAPHRKAIGAEINMLLQLPMG